MKSQRPAARPVNHYIRHTRSTLRKHARARALDALSRYSSLTNATSRRLETPRVHFLYTHSIPEKEEAKFHELLDALTRTHTLVPYSAAVALATSGRIDRPYVCFSFDDAFKSNLRTARILEHHGTTGCFFVPTGFVGVSRRDEAEQFFRTDQNVEDTAMSWDDLRSLAQHGHEIGSHTQSHPDCSTLSREQLDHELKTSRSELAEQLDIKIDHFAWPFGRFHHFSTVARNAARSAGFRTVASAERGSHLHADGIDETDLCIRRDQFMTSWPLEHTLYLLGTSAREPLNGQSTWPDTLSTRREK